MITNIATLLIWSMISCTDAVQCPGFWTKCGGNVSEQLSS